MSTGYAGWPADMGHQLQTVEIENLRAELAAAKALLADAKRDLRIAAKCMNPMAPVFRQFNDTADRIVAALSGENAGHDESTYGGVPFCDLSAADKERVNLGIIDADSAEEKP